MPSRVEEPEPPIGANRELGAPAEAPPQASSRRRPRRRLPLDPLPESPSTPEDAPAPGAAEGPLDAWSAAVLDVERRPGRAARLETCPFLRAAGPQGALDEPRDTIDERNRCSAVGAPLPLSGPQQELVCLAASHATCPRYVQGVAAVEARLLGRPVRRGPPLSIAAAFSVLALTALAVAAYMAASGGLALALPPASPSGVLSGAGTASPVSPPAAVLPATASPIPAAAPTPTPTDIPIPTAPPSPSPTPSPEPSPTTIADRFRGLDRCEGPEVCYVYVVRSGDNLSSISNYFGSTLDAVLDMNPQIEDPGSIHAGDEIHLPPP